MGKRGPQRQDGKRMANGRLSRKPADVTKLLNGKRESEEREILRTGVEARHRIYGIEPKDLLDPDAGSFVGRLRLTGEISRMQCDAADEYRRVYEAMQHAVAGPKPSGAVDLNATKGLPSPENVQRSVQAMAAWKSATNALQARQNELRGGASLIAALDYCVLRDEPHHHMVGWLREGLNALVRHFQIEGNTKAA